MLLLTSAGLIAGNTIRWRCAGFDMASPPPVQQQIRVLVCASVHSLIPGHSIAAVAALKSSLAVTR